MLTDFQNYFTLRIKRKFVIILSLKISPDFTCVTECQVLLLKATIENKTTSVTTHFKKLTTGNNAFVVSVVQSNCRILQLLHHMFNMPALLLDDVLLKCVVIEVVLFSIVAFKTLDISQGSVVTQLKCGAMFDDSIITNFLLTLRVK